MKLYQQPIMQIGESADNIIYSIYPDMLSQYDVSHPALDSKETGRNSQGTLVRGNLHGYKGRFLALNFTFRASLSFTRDNNLRNIIKTLEQMQFYIKYRDIISGNISDNTTGVELSEPVRVYASFDKLDLMTPLGYHFKTDWSRLPGDIVSEQQFFLCKELKVNIVSYSRLKF